MAAIERKSWTVFAGAAFLALATPLQGDRISDVRAQLTYVASALASSNPTDALSPFEKSMIDYDKLSQYFAALTASYDVTSAIEVLEEDDAEQETTLKVSWALQVSDRVNNSNVQRTSNATIHLKPMKGKWKIVSFTPVEMFDPQPANETVGTKPRK